MDSPPPLSTSTEPASEPSTRQRRGRKPTKGPRPSRQPPLYKQFEDLSNPDIPKNMLRSIKKSKKCMEYRDLKKKEASECIAENAVLKAKVQENEQRIQDLLQANADKDLELQQKDEKIQFQEQRIADMKKEILQKEQDNRQKDQTIQALVNYLNGKSEPNPAPPPATSTNALHDLESPLESMPSAGCGIDCLPYMNDSFISSDPDSVSLQDIIEQRMEEGAEEYSIMKEMENPVKDPVPDISDLLGLNLGDIDPEPDVEGYFSTFMD